MMEFYIIIVALLLILAATDLMVGVANDAVNFLNSAIGAKVAPRHIILIVASLGVFVGATFSSGLMEVARKGIFNPDLFVFADVMVIFLAVMITDIMLLDLFNTFGLPTSTTVSLIFELLGAAVAVAVIKIVKSGDLLSTLPDYINTSSATNIVTAIFSSVIIGFVAGSIIQYFSRLLFTFDYERRMKWVGGIWSGAALAFLTYYLLFKGIKGASFVSDDFVKWIGEHTTQLLLISFVFWSLIMQTLIAVFRVNVLKVVVLFGTFSLAMAFAGNDLVNFIGAPIAGLESFLDWRSSGIAAEEFTMEILKEPVKTDTRLSLIAGVIMVLTLWLSKKARTVTDTEVSLGRQDEGIENFAPNFLARGIVNIFGVVGIGLRRVIPESWRNKAEHSFQPVSIADLTTADRPAFDLVRASVNLTIDRMSSTIRSMAIQPTPWSRGIRRLSSSIACSCPTGAEGRSAVLGRHRIVLGNARFVGNVGFRQNEQTFDALRASFRPFEHATLTYIYVDRVRRIFGDDSPQGEWQSDKPYCAGRSGFARGALHRLRAAAGLPERSNTVESNLRTALAKRMGDRRVSPKARVGSGGATGLSGPTRRAPPPSTSSSAGMHGPERGPSPVGRGRTPRLHRLVPTPCITEDYVR